MVNKEIGALGEKIIDYGKKLIAQGLVSGSGGNISHRLPEGKKMLITPSGMAYDKLQLEDLVIMDIETGDVVEGHRKPSIEKGLHRAILQARPDVQAIVHCHSKHASAVAATRNDIPPVLDNMVAYFGGGVITAPHAPIGSLSLADNVVKALGERPVALMANHGAVAVGKDLSQAFLMAELLEECAQIYLLSFLAGGPVALTEKEVEEEIKWLQGKYGQA
ncbi:class II aldolase/adducin family protein [Heliorestis convoluta]|uniref:Class II aldolase/adducin family protein n=1 Tax=Heliorestis convoluta TaxID=356322 RepID=A0A5Q2N641_9FIRM|nr:class II aldolase/adducin family protein [Heliorestis convoluta]QGG49096.1 class II aldolase/adducin family protein [Heliorestis convoluta]